MNKKLTVRIEGMDCENEAKIIRAGMERLKGVGRFEINVVSGTLMLDYDEKVLTEQDIVRAIDGTGMRALKKEEAGRTAAWWREPRIPTLSVSGVIILAAFISEHIFGLSHDKAIYLYGTATLIGGYYPAKMGLAALKTLRPNIRTLMVAGAFGAIALDLWEEAALLVLIYSLGDVLEAYASDRVRNAVKKLMELAPKEALVKRNGKEVVLKVEDVTLGDTIIIRPGEKLPLDGRVIRGASSLDQSPITGESIPVSKGPGDDVFAGSINQRGAIDVEVTKPFKDTTLGKILHYVEEAETRKSSYQRFGETFGRYYTPFMFALSLVVIIVPTIFMGGFSQWFYRGLVVLVVSCSCGIALSIPVAVVAAVANAARHGVLIKGGASLESLSRIRAIAFDKTGSLTTGKPIVTDIFPFREKTEEEILSLTASIESRSEHPLADAIMNRAKQAGVHVHAPDWFEAVPGMGAKAMMDGKVYCVGSKALCGSLGALASDAEEKINNLEAQGKTVIVSTVEKELMGIIAVRDELRPETKDALRKLKDFGMKDIIMLTGDNKHVARAMSKEAGIDRYMAELLPEDKVNAVNALKKEYGIVGMVGDGVNDAPAMATSDVGIAMGAAGTDVAIETGDVVLMSDDLSKIPYVISLSRRATNNMKQNIALSLAVIAFLVPMALMGWIGLVPGILINEIGGIMVIINGLRLLR